MAILKRATKKLREAGIEHIVIKSGLWGKYLYDPRLMHQTAHVYNSEKEAVEAAISGERPTNERKFGDAN